MNRGDITKAQAILATLISYGRQPSTYRGIIMVATAAGITIDPVQYQGVIAGGMLLYGLINFFRNEKKEKLELTPELIEKSGEAMLRAYYQAKRSKRHGSNANR